MFNSPILDLIILLSFFYFIGSLLLSSINEVIAGSFRLRQKHLRKALETLLFDGEWKTFVTDKLIASPHIESLMRKVGSYPAYIPAKNFVLAVIEQIGSNNYTDAATFQTAISNAQIPTQFKTVLTDLVAQAQGNLVAFEKNLEEFYNNAMDRTSGRYKKHIRIILIIIGLILSAALNIDTLKISTEALSDKQKLSQTVDKIVSELPNIKVNKDSTTTISIKSKKPITTGADSTKASGSNNITITVSTVGKALADTAKSGRDSTAVATGLKNYSALTVYLEQTTGYGLGYTSYDDFTNQWTGGGFSSFITKLLGIVITAFALQLSSNFWFDLINKAVNIRANGEKPKTAKSKS